MKGPNDRLKYDLRRVWECPACHHRERTGGEVTFRMCPCQRKVEPEKRVWMRLVHDGARLVELTQSFSSASSRKSNRASTPPHERAASSEAPPADPAVENDVLQEE